MGELQVNLPCTCGATLIARAADAGSAIPCKCGRTVAVPNLSKLRTLAGVEAYVTNPVEAIVKAQLDGADPAGDKCLHCGSTTPVFYRCTAVCEQSHTQRASSEPPGFWHWLLLPVVVNLLLWSRGKETYADRQGHDVEVEFMLPLCSSCTASVGNVTRTSVAKKLMQRVPLYRELLAFYPNLTLKVERM